MKNRPETMGKRKRQTLKMKKRTKIRLKIKIEKDYNTWQAQ